MNGMGDGGTCPVTHWVINLCLHTRVLKDSQEGVMRAGLFRQVLCRKALFFFLELKTLKDYHSTDLFFRNRFISSSCYNSSKIILV
jgi:hypothetical protein